ncbi:hypothetical protein BIW11_08113 [Tropilaelaps mercedesae]|uniref:Pyruvate phosphate dikinase AMP/ATP-binding domain-containing protein n=1 Tax=Tropilaelaps mercedesae TaxID=418985 RepID=A0A1V9XQZ6_9ACAR|nr:hypothetical protein BIW11_08113 [Tropilaelaps mercedesae]
MRPIEIILYFIYRIVLYFWRPVLRRGRFSTLYDLSSNSPQKNGILIPQKEFEEELPHITLDGPSIRKTSDSVQIFGQNSKGQILLASIHRQFDGRAIANLYVRLCSERSFCLPQPLEVDASNEEHFVAGNLRISCIHPMRRWRVAFNGHLKEIGADTAHLLHVKLIAVFASKVFVENEEPEEMFLFGYKTRSSGIHPLVKKSIIAFTENGISSVLGITSLPDVMSNFVFGYINFPSRQQRALQCCSATEDFFQPGKLAVDIGVASWKSVRLTVLEQTDAIEQLQNHAGTFWQQSLKFFKISLDGNPGYALISDCIGKKTLSSLPPVPRYLAMCRASPSSNPLVVSFHEDACAYGPLTGGKGSSLAVLTHISQDHKDLFRVPEGVCVTTAAYDEFISTTTVAEALEELEEVAASRPTLKELREVCEKICQVIASAELPLSIASVLSQYVNPSLRYAVRSSACGEDSEETSAAGQMETILGVKGFQAVLKAVARCWASQFSFIALQYRRHYGQPINVPMCVVVQQMIESEVSGVMFTVDPVSGNTRHITITANYGLGESVVSAAADPDTFVVAKTYDSREVEFVQEELGEKKLFTVLSETGGTRDVTGEARLSEACLSREQVLELAKVALVLERAYAAPRDTEWAYFKDKLFMLQARPVTSLDQIDTQFEFLHESDQGMDSEIDALSKANVG